MQQSGTETASISAVSKDKFVSSLRESSGLNIGAQKEMSVIEQHRKSSLQKQRMAESWDTRATGFSVGEAHTGRTAAYGGRDYESSRMISASASAKSQQRTAASSSSRQSLSSSWAVQEQTSRNVSASSVSHQRSSATASASHQSSMATMQQQHQASTSRRDVSALAHSSFGQEQVTGFARNLGTSHSALIKADQVIRHEASASSAARVERSQGGRRRTWAESSLMHGGAAAIGQSIYAQDYHQPICPASKVYADNSSFTYERQSNSGHKIFKKK